MSSTIFDTNPELYSLVVLKYFPIDAYYEWLHTLPHPVIRKVFKRLTNPDQKQPSIVGMRICLFLHLYNTSIEEETNTLQIIVEELMNYENRA